MKYIVILIVNKSSGYRYGIFVRIETADSPEAAIKNAVSHYDFEDDFSVNAEAHQITNDKSSELFSDIQDFG
jgi:hypothetical protein